MELIMFSKYKVNRIIINFEKFVRKLIGIIWLWINDNPLKINAINM